MLSTFISTRVGLGFATVALTCLGHASSVLDSRPAGQVVAPSWLEPLSMDGLPREGVLGAAGDRDYFRIDVTGPTPAAIYASGGADTRGVLYDPDGRVIASDDDRGEGQSFHIDTILPRRGTYFLQVTGHTSYRTSYTLHAERRESPKALPLDGTPLEGAILMDREADYFRLDVSGPTLAAIYTSGGFDGQGTLFDPDGRVIASDDDRGARDNFRINAVLPRRGTYHLRVEQENQYWETGGKGSGYDLSDTGSYTLHAERLEPPKALPLDGTPQEGAISTGGEADIFRLDVTGPTLAAIYTSGDFDTYGVLLDPDGREVAGNNDGGEGPNFRIATMLARRGTYYLKVQHRYSSTRTGSYTLHAERLESPKALPLDGTPQEGAISTGGEADVFRLDVTGPTLAAIYTSGDFDTYGVLLDPDGREVAWNDDGGGGRNFRIATMLARRGTYYLKVRHSYSSTRTGSYTLHADTERLGSPGPLRLGGPPHQGAILTAGEEDFFRLDVAEPIKAVIHTSGGVDTGGELYDPDGALIAWDDDGGGGNNFRIDTVLLRRGAHLLRILSSDPASTGSYTLHAAGAVGGSVTPGGRIAAGGSEGAAPATSGFDLDPANADPLGIVFADGMFHVVDYDDDKVYAYDATGQRVPAAEFDLNVDYAFGTGITFTFANGRFHVTDSVNRRVLAYDASGQRDPAADFDLDPNNDDPEGITFGVGRFHVVDEERRVFAYDTEGRRVASAEFDLHPENTRPQGIAFANGRLYVVDSGGDKVYAYGTSGQRVPAADIDLDSENYAPRGMTFANGRFYVVDVLKQKVFAY